MREEKVAFYADSLEPLRLEGILALPEGEGPYRPCILCHPHPIGGGSMHVALLKAISDRLAQGGWAVLRFNFRGVGESEGVSTGGIREIEDIEGAWRFLADRGDMDLSQLSLAGWSFGSWVGLRWAVEKGRCRRVAVIGPPMVGFDFFHFLEGKAAPFPFETLIICGDRDQFSDPGKVADLAARLGAETCFLPGADHFLFGREREVAEVLYGKWSGGGV
ncbi:MAG: alpha/beta family hydrolase [Candidatus Geothermincolales bacterium]